MVKKLGALLGRDLLASKREFLMVYIIIIPIILAVAIELFAPGLGNLQITVALLESDEPAHIEYLDQYTNVELFGSVEELERRVLRRDEVPGIVPSANGGYEIILEGNESEVLRQQAATFNALYELGATAAQSTAEIYDFGFKTPPLKTALVNMLIILSVMLSGMLISLGIVEEKADKTIKAINVTPVTQGQFVIGKSLIGGIVTLVSIVASLFITGYYDINWLFLLMAGFGAMVLSMLIGFIQGLNSSDIIEAASGVKMVMVPIAAGIAVYELVAANWQWTMYWNPFYWAYRLNAMILSKEVVVGEALLYAGLVLALAGLMYLVFMPRIRKGLN